IVGGTLVSAGLYIVIALPALWMNDTMAFFWIVDKSVLLLGGAYIPVALMPEAFQKVASLAPFGAPMFATQMFNPSFPSQWLSFVLIQLIWIGVLFYIVMFMFKKIQSKVSINGG
ncbi:hypothetical protein HGB07_03280, partial [Candidatus Roizmanbacteria bacterium]|nr:hypothetical protein [Candidatus Roizmanbacteria bacterium]